jgi:hypothetical protein
MLHFDSYLVKIENNFMTPVNEFYGQAFFNHNQPASLILLPL